MIGLYSNLYLSQAQNTDLNDYFSRPAISEKLWRGGGHSRNERCPVGAESESRPQRAELLSQNRIAVLVVNDYVRHIYLLFCPDQFAGQPVLFEGSIAAFDV